MPPLRFSLRQLSLSIAWIGIGFGCLAFSMQRWNFPLDPRYDHWVTIVGAAQIGAIVCGLASIDLSLINLIANQQRLRMLVYSLLGALMGLLIAVAFSPFHGQGFQQNLFRNVYFGCMLLGSIAVAIGISVVGEGSQPEVGRRDL